MSLSSSLITRPTIVLVTSHVTLTTTSTNAQGNVFTVVITAIQQYVSAPSITPTSTTDDPTSYLPLTTTFVQPTECTYAPPVLLSSKTHSTGVIWIQGGFGTSSCFPPGFPFSTSKIVYSPGICPAGWTSACTKTDTSGSLTQQIVSCCPPSYECAHSIPQVLEARFGCVSSQIQPSSTMSIREYFPDEPPDPMPVYQIPVMIVPSSNTFQSNTTTAPPPWSSIVPPVPSPSGLSKGAIAGIVVGAMIGGALIVLLVVMALRIRKKRNAAVQNASTNDNERDLKASGAPEVWHGDSTPYSAQHYQGPVELPGTEPVFEMRGTEAASEMRGTEPVSEMRGS